VEIKKDEIKETKIIGKLNGKDVKLVTLKGGFNIGIGVASKDKEDVLAVGSHAAIVCHQISKKFANQFEESMNKSEEDSLGTVIEYSQNLSPIEADTLGFDIYAIKKNESVVFKLTKHNFDVFEIIASEQNNKLVLEKTIKQRPIPENVKDLFSEKLDKTIKQYAHENGLKINKKF
jgi:hypothetical protein